MCASTFKWLGKLSENRLEPFLQLLRNLIEAIRITPINSEQHIQRRGVRVLFDTDGGDMVGIVANARQKTENANEAPLSFKGQGVVSPDNVCRIPVVL